MKCFKTHNVILTLNDLIIKLIDEECLKEKNEKLSLMSKKKNYKDKKKKNKKRNVNKNKNKNEMYTHCKKAVHFKNNYWKLHSEKMPEELKKKQETKKKKEKKKKKKKFLSFEDKYNENTVILTAVKSYSLVINKMSWIADFNTTQHMCCDLSAFSSIKMFNNEFSIREVSEVTYTQKVETINLQLKNSDEKS